MIWLNGGSSAANKHFLDQEQDKHSRLISLINLRSTYITNGVNVDMDSLKGLKRTNYNFFLNCMFFGHNTNTIWSQIDGVVFG